MLLLGDGGGEVQQLGDTAVDIGQTQSGAGDGVGGAGVGGGLLGFGKRVGAVLDRLQPLGQLDACGGQRVDGDGGGRQRRAIAVEVDQRDVACSRPPEEDLSG